ncbi:hypothetical protein EsDP_00005125 [Epichloe bromicola]|uniref:Uncharacterized protein n=1 Tax=Epichloe bromicola TaxID=79588 RepID=A0ABQ0CU58_9HYPO
MRIGSSTRFLAAFLISASALETQLAALLRIDLEQFPDQVYEAACHSCCPVTIRTVLSTVISTIFQDRTEYVTATQHDVSTQLEYITQFVTTTATTTHASSYPVTITKTVGCHGHHYKSVDPSNPEDNAVEVQRLEGRTDGCHTTTVTEWITTTATRLVTGIESIIKTQTLPVTVSVPTTVHDTKTIIGSTTIWMPTTYVRTTTVISEHPVTRTVDNTIYTTRSTTVYTTMVSTVATSYPAISYITKSLNQTVTAPGHLTTITRPAETITRSGEIITKPAQTITKAGKTVTVPAQPSTVTLPAETQTVPGSTVVKTLTRTLPPTTVKITQDQATKTIVQPGTQVTQVQTQTLPPSLITKPASTVTVTPVFDVTLCPTPTGATAPLSPTSDLTFGCKPGYVCNPPKPNGCNTWPGPPADDFLCDTKDCIPSPPFTNTTWDQCNTHYYPPSYGYFNLDPEVFGLSYDIFESQSYEEVVNGHITTVTTGNWEPQKSLAAWPKPIDTSRPVSPAVRARAAEPSQLRDCRSKRDITPAICFDDCNNAYVIALAQVHQLLLR